MTQQQATRWITATLACFLMCMPLTTRAQILADMPQGMISARELYGFCTSRYDTDLGFCNGYVTAVTNRMAVSAIDGYGPCTFGAARGQQFVDLFTAYGAGYPDSLHAPADSIIAAAIGRAFPCQKM